MFSIRTEFNQWLSDPDRMLLLRPTLLVLRKVQHLGQITLLSTMRNYR